MVVVVVVGLGFVELEVSVSFLALAVGAGSVSILPSKSSGVAMSKPITTPINFINLGLLKSLLKNSRESILIGGNSTYDVLFGCCCIILNNAAVSGSFRSSRAFGLVIN